MAARKTRDYEIAFRWLDESGRHEESRIVHAADRAQAERRLRAQDDLLHADMEILSIKAVRGTARDADEDRKSVV